MRDSPPEPTKTYGISLALACVGITFVGIGLQSARQTLSGNNPFSGGSYGATIGALLTFGLLYLERATRWQTLPAYLQRVIGHVITLALIASMTGTVFCLYVAITRPASPNLPMVMGLVSAVSQVFTLYWLGRERPRYSATANQKISEKRADSL